MNIVFRGRKHFFCMVKGNAIISRFYGTCYPFKKKKSAFCSSSILEFTGARVFWIPACQINTSQPRPGLCTHSAAAASHLEVRDKHVVCWAPGHIRGDEGTQDFSE